GGLVGLGKDAVAAGGGAGAAAGGRAVGHLDRVLHHQRQAVEGGRQPPAVVDVVLLGLQARAAVGAVAQVVVDLGGVAHRLGQAGGDDQLQVVEADGGVGGQRDAAHGFHERALDGVVVGAGRVVAGQVPRLRFALTRQLISSPLPTH